MGNEVKPRGTQYAVVLNTGRFGDWIVLEAESEEDALKKARRRTKRPIAYVKRCIRPHERGLL